VTTNEKKEERKQKKENRKQKNGKGNNKYRVSLFHVHDISSTGSGGAPWECLCIPSALTDAGPDNAVQLLLTLLGAPVSIGEARNGLMA